MVKEKGDVGLRQTDKQTDIQRQVGTKTDIYILLLELTALRKLVGHFNHLSDPVGPKHHHLLSVYSRSSLNFQSNYRDTS